MPEAVSILGGTGALGFGLALRLARAGVPVTLGAADPARAREAALRIGPQVDAGSFADAARANDLVVLCVPFRSQSEVLTNLKTVLRPGQLLVDCTVPTAAAVSGRATRLLGVPQGSAAEQAAEMVPDGVRVVSALHTVSGATLKDLDHDLDEDVLVCGDEPADKARVIALVEQVPGLRGVDCGPLELARRTEALKPLLTAIDLHGDGARAGIKITSA